MAEDVGRRRIHENVEIHRSGSDHVEGLQATGYPRLVDSKLTVLKFHALLPDLYVTRLRRRVLAGRAPVEVARQREARWAVGVLPVHRLKARVKFAGFS